MAVTRFQDLIAWQRARELAHDVDVVTLHDAFSRDFGLKDQTRRAAVSVMANIAERFGRNRPLELLRFLDIAQGSCTELHSHLFIALDIGYLTAEEFAKLQSQCESVGMLNRRLTQSVARSSRGTRDEGQGTSR